MILSDEAVAIAFDSLEKKSRDQSYRDDPVSWAHDVLGVELWSKQREVLMSLVTNKKTAVKSCHASGKLEAVTNRVPTPTGMRLFGDLKVGDQVLDVYGNPTTVTYVTPDQYHDLYDVVFDDGTSVTVGLDHLWQVQDLTQRPRKVSDWRDRWDATTTKTTREILAALKTDGGQYRWRVPCSYPVQRPHNDNLPIDPYVLGVWLGDGAKQTGYVYGGDTKTFYADLFDDVVVTPDPRNQTVKYSSKKLTAQLGQAGLLNNKHIPDMYLWDASESQRKALLSGLMDSDGFCGTSCGIDLTNKRLADDVVQLLHTLGVKVGVSEGEAAYTKDGVRKVTGTRYRINFTVSWNPFRNRGQNWQPPKTSKHTLRTIREIKLSETQTISRCITVDNPLSCYLTGNALVPTHNTFLSAVAACWWVSTRENAMVRSTAPTSYQVHELLWEEIRKLHAIGGLIGEVNQKDVWKKPVYGVVATVGSGQKPSDTNIHSFQGVHRPDGVLTILDEGCGISKPLYTAADSISTGREDRVLTVGNPDDPSTPFGEIFLKPTYKENGSDMWNRITISAFDTPNFSGEKVSDIVKASLIQKEWVEERRREWGEESGRYRAKILAEFPDQSDNSFFAQRVIDTGIDTNIPEDYENPLKLGVDIAGGGEDETVIYGNRGGRIRKIDSWPEGDAVYTANRILEVATRLGAKEIRIDAVGFGAAVVDIIKKDPRHANFVIAAVKGSFMPKNNAAHANARAEHYDAFRFGLSQKSIDLDPHDTVLKDELLAIQYKLTDRGAIQIESKREVRKRGDKSPDNLDAAIYSYIDISELFEEEEQGLHSMSAADFLEMLPAWANLPW